MHLIKTLAAAAVMLLPVSGTSADDGDKKNILDAMKLRNIGPAYMSGRIADIEVDRHNPDTWWVAVGSGGVWKTVNAGITWTPVFDKQPVYSIGDVTLDPSNSNIVWVGTGENNGGRHISFGDGVYRSDNGGKTWKNMGLPDSEHISDIIVHPGDGDTVFVSSQGPLWSKGGERGLYKTTDGGETWRQVLKPDNDWTGVTSLVMDPDNPDRLYAATWQRQRTVAAYVGTGPGSAIHTSDDGGETWTKMSVGLPSTNMGKIGLAISPATPDTVYAVIELDQRKGGVWRTTNRGASWEKMSDEVSGGTGPHYYQELFADPTRAGRIFIASNYSKVSNDGGKTWHGINLKNKHVDDHAMAFDPSNPDFILIGSDGGVYESRDNMKKWRYVPNLPITQFYKIAVDDAEPFYYVYGGTQDNSSQGGPSRTARAEGITDGDWFLILDWDGHQPATEPGNPDIVYGQRQQGNLARFDRKTGEYVSVMPQAKPGEPAERYNWDAPILVSTHDPKRLYHASQRVWRSDDRGNSWRPLSGDLTRNGNRMEMPVMDRTWSVESGFDLYAMSNYHTIANISESPVDENILYAGTDDGLIQVTSDGGATWTRYEIGRIRGIPDTAYVNDIRADLFDADTVYAALDNHKYGDYKPYLIKSTDRGRSWKSIASNLPDKHLVWRIVQDHVDPDLMFIGTEFGLFVTTNGGGKWSELNGGVPTISFRDVQIQRRENDLVAGSFGRGIFVLDDYTPLRGLKDADLEQDALLFPARTGDWFLPETMHTDSAGDARFVAPNPDFGATLTYYLKDGFNSAKEERQSVEKKLEEDGKAVSYPAWEAVEAELKEASPAVFVLVRDADGNVVRRVAGSAKAGLHRVTWSLRYPPVRPVGSAAGFFGSDGVLVAPGTYSATLHATVDGETSQLAGPVSFDVEVMRTGALDGATPAERTAFVVEVQEVMRAMTAASAQIADLKKQMADFRAALDASNAGDSLEADYHTLRREVLAVAEAAQGMASNAQMGARAPTIGDRMFMVSMARANTWGPTMTQREQLGYAMEEFAGVRARLDALVSNKVPAFQQKLQAAGAPWTDGAPLP